MIELDKNVKTNIADDIYTDNYVQRLTIIPNEALKVVITIPHNLFEWFVDVFDIQNQKIYSNWLDHYGDTNENLKSEMKESVERFIQAITQYPLRVVIASVTEQSTLEIYVDEKWTADIY